MLSGDSDGRDAEEQVEGGQPPATWVAHIFGLLLNLARVVLGAAQDRMQIPFITISTFWWAHQTALFHR